MLSLLKDCTFDDVVLLYLVGMVQDLSRVPQVLAQLNDSESLVVDNWYFLEVRSGFVLARLEIIECLGAEANPDSSLEFIRVNLVNLLQIFKEDFVNSNIAARERLTDVKYQAEKIISNFLRKVQFIPQLFVSNISPINHCDHLVVFISQLVGNL